MEYYFAPMEGITGAQFRQIHHSLFPGVDKYYIPFLSPTQDHVFTPRDLRAVLPEHNQGFHAVPQLLTRNAQDFLWAAGALADMGYEEVNLNLGCPSGTVTAKGKGAGLLGRREELERMLDGIFAAPPTAISLKTRLGMEDPEEFPALLELFSRYPVSLLIIHPRVRQDFYRRPVRMDSFRFALDHYRGPICFNGGLLTPEDYAAFAREFPQVDRVMLGQGRRRPGAPPAGRACRLPGGAAPVPRRPLPHLCGPLCQPAQRRLPHEGAVALPVPPLPGPGKGPEGHPQGVHPPGLRRRGGADVPPAPHRLGWAGCTNITICNFVQNRLCIFVRAAGIIRGTGQKAARPPVTIKSFF